MTNLLTLARLWLIRSRDLELAVEPDAATPHHEALRLARRQLEQRVYQVARLTRRLRRSTAALADAIDAVHRVTLEDENKSSISTPGAPASRSARAIAEHTPMVGF